MMWLIAICLVQAIYMIVPPFRYWSALVHQFRCWRKKCPCRQMHQYEDLPPNVSKAMKDMDMNFFFINSCWNFTEGKWKSVRKRVNENCNAYFNGFRPK